MKQAVTGVTSIIPGPLRLRNGIIKPKTSSKFAETRTKFKKAINEIFNTAKKYSRHFDPTLAFLRSMVNLFLLSDCRKSNYNQILLEGIRIWIGFYSFNF